MPHDHGADEKRCEANADNTAEALRDKTYRYKIEFTADSPEEAKEQLRRVSEFALPLKGRDCLVTELAPESEDAEPKPPQYFVYKSDDATRGFMDGCIVWWRAKGHGYTNKLDDAGIFTESDRQSGYPPERSGCVYVPVDIVRSVARTSTHVWIRDLQAAMGRSAEDGR